MRKRIKNWSGFLTESSQGDFRGKGIRTMLFALLKEATEITKSDYIWGSEASEGAPVMWIDNLSESDFFNTSINTYDLILKLWTGNKVEYMEEMSGIYYGLVYGYSIYHEPTKTHCVIQIVRWATADEGRARGVENPTEIPRDIQFTTYIDPLYKEATDGEIEGETEELGDEIYALFGLKPEDPKIYEPPKTTFEQLAVWMAENLTEVDHVKEVFRYLDPLI